MYRGMMLAVLCGAVLASGSASARSIESLELELERASTRFDSHCSNYYEDSFTLDPARDRISRQIVDKLQPQLEEIDAELDYHLRFLASPEEHVNRYLQGKVGPLKDRYIHERDELDAMRIRGADFAMIETQRKRVQETRTRWQATETRFRDPDRFHSFTNEQIDLANRRVVDLRRVRERTAELHNKAWMCNVRAKGAYKFADDDLNPPEEPTPPAVAPAVGSPFGSSGGAAK